MMASVLSQAIDAEGQGRETWTRGLSEEATPGFPCLPKNGTKHIDKVCCRAAPPRASKC